MVNLRRQPFCGLGAFRICGIHGSLFLILTTQKVVRQDQLKMKYRRGLPIPYTVRVGHHAHFLVSDLSLRGVNLQSLLYVRREAQQRVFSSRSVLRMTTHIDMVHAVGWIF